MQSTDSSQYLHLSLAETLTAQVSQGKLTNSILLLYSGSQAHASHIQANNSHIFQELKENNLLFPFMGKKRDGEKLSQNSDVFP